MRHLFSQIAKTVFGRGYADLAVMEDILAGSGLDWTVIRPPKLTDKPLTGRYRTAFGHNLRGGWSVPRADVAHLMLRALGQPDTICHVIGIASQQPHRSNRRIAEALMVTLDTAKKHVLDKLGADNRTEAVTRGRQLGLIR
jgi:hypothetical protein